MSGMSGLTPSATGLLRFHHDMRVRVARVFYGEQKDVTNGNPATFVNGWRLGWVLMFGCCPPSRSFDGARDRFGATDFAWSASEVWLEAGNWKLETDSEGS
jgi:hypothetical protein